jgi:hypothetical protein
MFNLKLEIPTYAEWKVQMEKFLKDQPEQAKKYQDQVQKSWQDSRNDIFKIK